MGDQAEAPTGAACLQARRASPQQAAAQHEEGRLHVVGRELEALETGHHVTMYKTVYFRLDHVYAMCSMRPICVPA